MIVPAAEKVPVRPVPPLALAGAAPLQPNGDFVVSIERQGRWLEVGRLGADRFLREQRLDLAPWLQNAQKAHVRIRQAGGGASHLDAVLLGGRAPIGSSSATLNKLSRRDNDLATAGGREIDLTFAALRRPLSGLCPAASKARSSARSRCSSRWRTPSGAVALLGLLLLPPGQLRSAAAAFRRPRLAGRGRQRRQPFFEALSPTGSGHPTGYTYGWVSNDVATSTSPSTSRRTTPMTATRTTPRCMSAATGGCASSRSRSPKSAGARPHFVYTDKVAYQHKVYDFAIPLSELPAAADSLDLCFAAYGTASATTPEGVNLAYEPALGRYLLVYSIRNGSSIDVLGRFVAVDGRQHRRPLRHRREPRGSI